MLRRLSIPFALIAVAACANSNSSRGDHDQGREAATEAERLRDRMDNRVPSSASDNSLVDHRVDEVRSRSSNNAQDPK